MVMDIDTQLMGDPVLDNKNGSSGSGIGRQWTMTMTPTAAVAAVDNGRQRLDYWVQVDVNVTPL